jgi:glutaredoxin
MKKILLLLAALAIYQYHHQLLRQLQQYGIGSAPAGPAQGEVMLFTFSACGQPCDNARADLRSRALTLREYPLDDNEENQKLFHEYSPQNALPAIILKDRVVNGYSHSELSAALASSYGSTMLSADEKEFMARHFSTDGKPRVVLYGTRWCPYCKKMRENFRRDHIEFIDIDVEAEPERQRLTQALEIGGYPLTYVGYERILGDNYAGIREKMQVAVNR